MDHLVEEWNFGPMLEIINLFCIAFYNLIEYALTSKRKVSSRVSHISYQSLTTTLHLDVL